MKGSVQIQKKGLGYVIAVLMAALLILGAKVASDYRNAPVKRAIADAKTQIYFAEHPGPFCAFEGVWYDWERDETIRLSCLGVKGKTREGSFSSSMGARAISNFSMSGTYDIDPDSTIQVFGKDREGRDVTFAILINVEEREYPTQMIAIDEKGTRGFYIWKRKE
jgi:hypothetical protein